MIRRTRRRIAWVSIALLLLLDAGRSINARVGYAKPTELWQPDAAAYADLSWPPGAIDSHEARGSIGALDS